MTSNLLVANPHLIKLGDFLLCSGGRCSGGRAFGFEIGNLGLIPSLGIILCHLGRLDLDCDI